MAWNPQESMLTILAAAENGEPSTVTPADLLARAKVLVKKSLVGRGWNEHNRTEMAKIGEALGIRKTDAE